MNYRNNDGRGDWSGRLEALLFSTLKGFGPFFYKDRKGIEEFLGVGLRNDRFIYESHSS